MAPQFETYEEAEQEQGRIALCIRILEGRLAYADPDSTDYQQLEERIQAHQAPLQEVATACIALRLKAYGQK